MLANWHQHLAPIGRCNHHEAEIRQQTPGDARTVQLAIHNLIVKNACVEPTNLLWRHRKGIRSFVPQEDLEVLVNDDCWLSMATGQCGLPGNKQWQAGKINMQ